MKKLHTKIIVSLPLLLLVTGLFSPSATANVEPVEAKTTTESSAPQSYIVTTTSGSDTDKLVTAAEKADAEVTATFDSVIDGFAADLTPAQVQQLENNPDVVSVEPDVAVRGFDTQVEPPSWGLDRVDQRTLPLNKGYTYRYNGSGVKVFVLDGGLLTSHEQYSNRATLGPDFVDGTNNSSCNTHATHVAGTISGSSVGVAKNASVVGVRVLNCQGQGSSSQIISALDWVRKNKGTGPAVVNMSLGSEMPSAAIDEAVQSTINAGITVVAAAGNTASDACQVSPARVPAVITVAATGADDARADYSNFGNCVDLFAPGTSVVSSTSGSNNQYGYMSGTSMATPHVAGVAAQTLQQYPSYTPANVATAIVGNASGNVVTNPMGSPNRLLFSEPGPVSGAPLAAPVISSPSSNATIKTNSITVRGTATNKADVYLQVVAPNGNTSTRLLASNGTWSTVVTSAADGEWKLRAYQVYGGQTSPTTETQLVVNTSTATPPPTSTPTSSAPTSSPTPTRTPTSTPPPITTPTSSPTTSAPPTSTPTSTPPTTTSPTSPPSTTNPPASTQPPVVSYSVSPDRNKILVTQPYVNLNGTAKPGETFTLNAVSNNTAPTLTQKVTVTPNGTWIARITFASNIEANYTISVSSSPNTKTQVLVDTKAPAAAALTTTKVFNTEGLTVVAPPGTARLNVELKNIWSSNYRAVAVVNQNQQAFFHFGKNITPANYTGRIVSYDINGNETSKPFTLQVVDGVGYWSPQNDTIKLGASANKDLGKGKHLDITNLIIGNDKIRNIYNIKHYASTPANNRFVVYVKNNRYYLKLNPKIKTNRAASYQMVGQVRKVDASGKVTMVNVKSPGRTITIR